MAKITLPTIAGGYASVTQLNTAFDQLETELQDKVLYRANPTGEPNQMGNDLDMNSNDILNGGSIACSDLTVNGASVASSATAAAASATAAATSATAAASSATAAASSATAAATSATAVENAKMIWQGEWSALTTYAINDAVSYNGSSWISLQDSNLNNIPADNAFWDYLAQKGAAGAGTGDVIGPASATSNSLARFDGTTGKLLKDGAIIGTDVQAYSVKLASYVSNTLSAANKIPYATALNTAGELTWNSTTALANSATTVSSNTVIKAAIDAMDIDTQVVPGTSGNVLTSNGTIWTSAAPAAVTSAFVLVETWAATASASKIFDLQEDVYCQWVFQVDGVIPATDDSRLYMQPGYSAGTVFDTANATGMYLDLATSAWGDVGGIYLVLGIPGASNGVGTAAGEHGHATITIGGVGATLAAGFMYESKCSFVAASGNSKSTTILVGYNGITKRVWDSVKFIWSAGSFEAAGTIKMFALKRAG